MSIAAKEKALQLLTLGLSHQELIEVCEEIDAGWEIMDDLSAYLEKERPDLFTTPVDQRVASALRSMLQIYWSAPSRGSRATLPSGTLSRKKSSG